MAIAIRGGTPATNAVSGTNPVTLTLNGTRQPQAGDVLIIIHGNNYYDLSNMATPTVNGSTAGVTAITNATADTGSLSAHAKCWRYVVGSTGDVTVSETETGAGDEEKFLVGYVLSGTDTSTVIDVSSSTFNATTTTSPVAPSVSPSSSDGFLICHTHPIGSPADPYSPPSGMTETYDTTDAGHNISLSGAVLQLSASGATGTKTFSSDPINPRGYLGISIVVLAGSGGGAATAPARPAVVTRPAAAALSTAILLRTPAAPPPPKSPLVVTTPATAAGRQVITARGTLVDPPVLTTASPIVVTSQPVQPRAAAISLRTAAAAVQAPATSTPQPLVVTTTPVAPPPAAIIARGSLADAPVLTTAAPYVVTAPTATPPAVAVLLRGSLADAPSVSPYVVTAPARATPGGVVLVRSSLVDAVVPAAPPVAPYVVTARTTPVVGSVVQLRGTLADPPVLTTASPYVVTAPSVTATTKALLARSSFVDTTPVTAPPTVPQVITTPVRVAPSRPLLLQGGPPDLATAEPLVISVADRPRRSQIILLSAPVPPPPAGPFGPTTVPIVVTAAQRRPAGVAVLSAPRQLGGATVAPVHPHPTVRVTANLTAPTVQYQDEHTARYLPENRVTVRLEP